MGKSAPILGKRWENVVRRDDPSRMWSWVSKKTALRVVDPRRS
jgi:hypothetical protein